MYLNKSYEKRHYSESMLTIIKSIASDVVIVLFRRSDIKSSKEYREVCQPKLEDSLIKDTFILNSVPQHTAPRPLASCLWDFILNKWS